MSNITQNKPLSFVVTSDGERILMPCTLEELEKAVKQPFLYVGQGRNISTARDILKKFGNASPVDYFAYYVASTLPPEDKAIWEDMERKIKEQKSTLTLQAINFHFEKRRKEREQEQEMARKPTEQELIQRRRVTEEVRNRLRSNFI